MSAEKESYIRDILKSVRTIDYIKPNEIPNIDLYMDQVTTFMDQHLESSKRYEDDKLLTKTMINNYTKNNLLPSPEKKKYTKDHMYLLIFIYYMKNILCISDIQSVLNPLTEMFYGKDSKISLEEIYEEIFRIETIQSFEVTKDLVDKLKKSKDCFENIDKTEEEQEFLRVFSFVCMLCFDVYMKKQVIEKMIDEFKLFRDDDEKNSKKKEEKTSAKKNEKAPVVKEEPEKKESGNKK